MKATEHFVHDAGWWHAECTCTCTCVSCPITTALGLQHPHEVTSLYARDNYPEQVGGLDINIGPLWQYPASMIVPGV